MSRAPDPAGPGPLDRETLERVRSRDPRAMNRFFDAYYDRVHAYATRLLRDPTLAEDLAQEAFLRMHGAIERLDPGRDPTPWVLTIVTNAIRDHWRSRAHRSTKQQVSLEEAWNLPSPDGEGDPMRNLMRSEEAEAVHRAMGRLSPADREILLLRSFRELDTAEVTGILGIGADAMRQRHSRAVKRLGEILRGPRGTEAER